MKKNNTEIIFVSEYDGFDNIKEFRPYPATEYMPEWFRNMPAEVKLPAESFSVDGYIRKKIPNIRTAKLCPSFVDIYNEGFVLPAPCDIWLRVEEDGTWEYRLSNPLFSMENQFEAFDIPFSVHPTHQYLDHVPNAPYDYIFKMDNVWSCVTPKGYSIMQIPMLWHHNPNFETAYGIIHTDQYHQLNIQIMMYKGVGNFEIKMGEPLCYIIPYKREEFNYTVEPYDTAFHNAANMRNIGVFTNGYKQLFRKLNKEEYKEV